MKYYQCPVSQTIGIQVYSQDCSVPVSCKSSKPIRSVHFPNDIVFQDYVRQGELERIGRFIKTRRVNLDTIYLSGESPTLTSLHKSYPKRLCDVLIVCCCPRLCRHGCHPWGRSVWEPGVCEAVNPVRSRYPPEGRGGMDPSAHGLQRRLSSHCTVSKARCSHSTVEWLYFRLKRIYVTIV